MIYKHFIFIVFTIWSLQAVAQTEIVNIGGTASVQLSQKVPESLTSDRSLVIIDMPPQVKNGFEVRSDWKKLATKTHGIFRKIGIDPIAYVFLDDLNAGPEVNNAYQNLFETRQVKNIILLQQVGNYPYESYRLLATEYSPDNYIENGQVAWQDKDQRLDAVMVHLGKQVLKQGIERTNFLIPESPDFLQEVQIFTGTRLENYPSRLKTYKLAVVAFQKVNVDESKLSAEDMRIIDNYNQSIDKKNERLAEILSSYPYKYEIVTETDEDKLYDDRFQYALLPMSSTAQSVKQLLQYKTLDSETHYMTNVLNQGKSELRRIPTNANVTKYYIKQTVVKDIHVGKVWDADVTWEKALENFLFNLTVQLK